MDDFLIRALLGGLGVAIVTGPLGAFVVWRRMAYFGDTLAHAALLGVALGALAGMDLNLAITGVGVGVAVLLTLLQRQRRLASDTLLGIVSHSALAFGLIALAFVTTLRVDLVAYLFGDILSVTWADVGWIWGGGLLVLAALAWLWQPLLALTVHEDLAQVDGVPVARTRLAFTVMIALVVAVAMKIVGVLLVTALMIIPAAAARRLSRTPEAMALGAAVAGMVAVVLGLGASLWWDLPAGPAVVGAASLLFASLLAVPGRRAG